MIEKISDILRLRKFKTKESITKNVRYFHVMIVSMETFERKCLTFRKIHFYDDHN